MTPGARDVVLRRLRLRVGQLSARRERLVDTCAAIPGSDRLSRRETTLIEQKSRSPRGADAVDPPVFTEMKSMNRNPQLNETLGHS